MDAKKEIEEIQELLEKVENEKQRNSLVSRFKKVWDYQKANDPKNKSINALLKNLTEQFKAKKSELESGKESEKKEEEVVETFKPTLKKKEEEKKEEKEEEKEKKEREEEREREREEEREGEREKEREEKKEKKESKKKEKEYDERETEVLDTTEVLENKKSDNFSKVSWKVLDTYFKANPNYLVNHQLDSYNQFMNKGIQKIFSENNPLKFIENRSDAIEHPNIILLYIGGKNADKIYYGKPIIYDENNAHFMYPNEARLRNMTYGLTIHYDVDVEMLIYDPEKDDRVKVEKTIEKVYLGRFPIMLNSSLCLLSGLTKEIKYNLGECRQDYGGYFVIDGKEKLIVPEEKFADNMIYVKEIKDDIYSHSVEVRSVSEDSSKPMRTTSIQMVAPSTSYTNGQLVVTIPNVRKPIPLFIVMRALGVISDRDIIKTCLLDMDKYGHFIDLFIPSVHDANQVFDQVSALKFIATFVKNKSVPLVLNILINMFIPHVGELNFVDKAYYIGYMTKKLLMVYLKEEPPTDRDSFLYKRIDLSGILLYDLFKEFYGIQKNTILMNIDKAYNAERDSGIYTTDFASIMANGEQYFKERIVEIGFKKAFKGNWGSQAYTKKVGVVQDLNRLSWFTALSHLRKSNLPMPEGAKVMGPRKLNGSQWGYIDILDVPEGSHIGFQKHLSITTTVTSGTSAFPIIAWFKKHIGITSLTECTPEYLSDTTKVFVNGNWIGNVDDPLTAVSLLRLNRRNGIIPAYTSVSFRIQNKEIVIYTDSGRLIRPIYYMFERKPSFIRPNLGKLITDWDGMVSGFGEKKVASFNYRDNLVFEPEELYESPTPEFLRDNQSMLDYIDVSEEETSLLAMGIDKLITNKHNHYTHLEIDPSTILGLMGNCIIFPENNPLPRNNFSGSQSRQAVSIYHTNFQNRIDKMGVVLNYGNVPLVKSRYLKYINDEQIPYGVNCVVAIMSYTGYNVEDAILFNEASLKRGLFRTSYYSMYEEREESSKISGGEMDSIFANIQDREVVGTKMGYDYSKLDEYGLIKEGEQIDDKTIVIGKIKIGPSGIALDDSKKPKKGQLGYVDKSFITEGETGFRLAKIRVREDRSPAIGDKFASRSGQKGTVGYIVPEANMPFTSQGIRPDLIINPHALPSRMTIGQLVESLLGKACSLYGTFGDCTAFVSKGPNTKTYGSLLQNYKYREELDEKFDFNDYHTDLQNIGYHSTGNQMLYNGMTGEQIESQIYIGVNYYMRLKHMVKDKINYRAQGPMNFLTRQSVHGRANDGGLRLGEMERDSIITHGLSTFLKKSFMDRADAYKIAVCNKTGLISIYNPEMNMMMSPCADGPIKFQMDVNSEEFTIDTTTRFGRTFSVVDIPYSFKLFLQELQVMGIQTRIITDKNIDKVLGISGTDNIIKLTNDTDVREVLKTHRSSIQKYADAYRKERMGQIEQKTKMASQKKKQRKIVAKPDKKEEEEDFERIPVDILEGGGGGEEVTYTLNDVPVEVPEIPTEPPSMPSNIVHYPQEMPATRPDQTPTQESVTDVLKVPEEKEEDKEKEESQGGETKKSITLNL
jgi:DNA-directed RNA polymerase II subunit RPB2